MEIDWGQYAQFIIRASDVTARTLPPDFVDDAEAYIFNFIMEHLKNYNQEKATPRTFIENMAQYGKKKFIRANKKKPFMANVPDALKEGVADTKQPFNLDDIPSDLKPMAYEIIEHGHDRQQIKKDLGITEAQYNEMRKRIKTLLMDLCGYGE